MGAFNETQLRLKFLQAREAYFRSMLASVDGGGQQQQQPQADNYTALCRVIEVTRICVFDTLTQYRALFSDEDAGGSIL